MSYRPRPRFDQPSPEELMSLQRRSLLLTPLWVVQLSLTLFRDHQSAFSQAIGLLAWATIAGVIVWILLGLPSYAMSREDRQKMNDEWSRYVSGEACRWGFVASIIGGVALVGVQIWHPVDPTVATYSLVNAALLVAIARQYWLNRGDPDEE